MVESFCWVMKFLKRSDFFIIWDNIGTIYKKYGFTKTSGESRIFIY
jgi:hypothetical protein